MDSLSNVMPVETREPALPGDTIRWTLHLANGRKLVRIGVVVSHTRWAELGRTGNLVMICEGENRHFAVPVSSDGWQVI